MIETIETIGKLVRIVPTFSPTENGEIIHNYFEENKESEGVVVVDDEKPAGILMRKDFYQKIGSQFGYSLYMKRCIHLVMKTDITCVDKSCDMAKFGFSAMNRDQDSLYDFGKRKVCRDRQHKRISHRNVQNQGTGNKAFE